jgi:hypothetical protein
MPSSNCTLQLGREREWQAFPVKGRRARHRIKDRNGTIDGIAPAPLELGKELILALVQPGDTFPMEQTDLDKKIIGKVERGFVVFRRHG